MTIDSQEWKRANVPQKRSAKANIVKEHLAEIQALLREGYTQPQIAQYFKEVYGVNILPNDIAIHLYRERNKKTAGR